MAKPGEPGYLFALVASCTFFMICSAGMLVVNKLVLRRFTGLPITVVMIQMAFTAVCLVVTPCGLHFGSARDVLRWSLTIPFLFTLMLASSMLALDYASMGAIIVVRNVAPIVTMVIERLFQERIEVSFAVVLSLVWVVGGVILYTVHDVHFSPVGMAYMMLNMVSAVLERLLQRKMIAVEPIDVSKGGMMLLNNAFALVPMGALLVWFGEYHKWARLRHVSTSDVALLLGSCVNAVGISYAGINAQGYVSATTFMVLSNLNKFVVVGFGMAVLREASSWQVRSCPLPPPPSAPPPRAPFTHSCPARHVPGRRWREHGALGRRLVRPRSRRRRNERQVRREAPIDSPSECTVSLFAVRVMLLWLQMGPDSGRVSLAQPPRVCGQPMPPYSTRHARV